VAEDRLTVAFPPHGEFARKKAEANRALLQRALHTLTGHTLALDYDLGAEESPAVGGGTLSEDELLERLKREFGATEVVDDPPDPT
jgi:hypothetical protein